MVKIATVSMGDIDGFKIYMTGTDGKPVLWESKEDAEYQIALWIRQEGTPKNFSYVIEDA